MENETVGQRIFKRRKELKLTLEEVGKAVGVPRSTVQRWEAGTIKNMGHNSLYLMAEALHTTADYLVGATDIPDVLTQRQRKMTKVEHFSSQADVFDFLCAEAEFDQVTEEGGTQKIQHGERSMNKTQMLMSGVMNETVDYFGYLLSRRFMAK